MTEQTPPKPREDIRVDHIKHIKLHEVLEVRVDQSALSKNFEIIANAL